uniref:Uncharacterized protein n=1 Tax=Acrobeloides nanus TaxID=290746 RepID=A0A914E7K2_9BILA
MDAGFGCEELLKICSFGGREFDCCAYARPLLTDMGKCYRLELFKSNTTWLQRQAQAGVNNGIQIIADFHKEEAIEEFKDFKFNFDASSNVPMFANEYEDGFRYYIHNHEDVPYLSTEGISASPGVRVYSAMSSARYTLLSTDNWGNCSDNWPKDFHKNVQYSATKCKALCRAQFFNSQCGCSPMVYNIEGAYPVCTASDLYSCLRNKLLKNAADKDSALLIIPKCIQCKVECDRWEYVTYNSYSIGYSKGALNWFKHQNPNWTDEYVTSNFVTIDIFFRDVSYTEYQQIQSTNLVTTLSNIGGNMGMWLGMSILSVIEVLIYFYKSSWIFISKKRRQYMVDKKAKEVEREKYLEETIEAAHHKAEVEETTLAEKTINRVRKIATTVRDRSMSVLWPNYVDPHNPIVEDPEISEPKIKISTIESPNGIQKRKIATVTDESSNAKRENSPRTRRQSVLDNIVNKKLFGSGQAKIEKDQSSDQVIELTIDLKQLLAHSDTQKRCRAQSIDSTVSTQEIHAGLHSNEATEKQKDVLVHYHVKRNILSVLPRYMGLYEFIEEKGFINFYGH